MKSYDCGSNNNNMHTICNMYYKVRMLGLTNWIFRTFREPVMMTGLGVWLTLLLCLSMANSTQFERCGDAAILRPGRQLRIADTKEGWVDISHMVSSIKILKKLSSGLLQEAKEILVESSTLTPDPSFADGNHLGALELLGSAYDRYHMETSKVKVALDKCASVHGYLPLASQEFITSASKIATTIDEKWISQPDYFYVIPVDGSAEINVMNRDMVFMAAGTITELGIAEAPTAPTLMLGLLDLVEVAKETPVGKIVNFSKADDEVTFLCVIPFRLDDEDKAISKGELSAMAKHLHRVSTRILEYAKAFSYRLSLVNPMILNIANESETLVFKTPHSVNEVLKYLTLLKPKSFDHIDGNDIDNIMHMEQAFDKVVKSNHFGNDNNKLYLENVGTGLSMISIDNRGRAQDEDSNEYLFGRIYGPTFVPASVYTIDRLIDMNGMQVKFHYLVKAGQNKEALMNHPNSRRNCRYDQDNMIICEEVPSEGKEGSDCGTSLYHGGTASCFMEPAGPGIRLYHAHCTGSRELRKFVATAEETAIQYSCGDGSTIKYARILKGTLALNGNCRIYAEGKELTTLTVENNTVSVVNNIKFEINKMRLDVTIHGYLIYSISAMGVFASLISLCGICHCAIKSPSCKTPSCKTMYCRMPGCCCNSDEEVGTPEEMEAMRKLRGRRANRQN